MVLIGDTVQARTPGGLRELEIVALGDKRGPAKVAQTLYIDHTPPPPPTRPTRPNRPAEARGRPPAVQPGAGEGTGRVPSPSAAAPPALPEAVPGAISAHA